MYSNKHVQYVIYSGESKLALLRADPRRYLVRAILAGMYLSIVGFAYWSLLNDLQASVFGKVVASAFFGVGPIMIVLTETELFSSNSLYLTISSARGKTGWRQTVFLWLTCFVGNFIGALVVSGLLWASGILSSLPPGHALFVGAVHKVHQPAFIIFSKGILANWLLCLGVRIAISCKEEIVKIAVLIMAAFMFLYFGGEHSIANLGTFSQVLFAGNTVTVGEAAFNLLFATLGNIVGGAVFLAIPFAYINPQKESELSFAYAHEKKHMQRPQ
jgi:nitrite transporter NirC